MSEQTICDLRELDSDLSFAMVVMPDGTIPEATSVLIWPTPLTPEFDSRYIVGVPASMYDGIYHEDHQNGTDEGLGELIQAVGQWVSDLHKETK